jgi:hypothetical protein
MLLTNEAPETEAPGASVGGFAARSMMEVTTTSVFADEPCFWLAEFNLPSRSGKTKSRYQLLKIVRNDRLVTAYIYLGPARKFNNDGFNMLGGIMKPNGRGHAVHTVGELQEGAEELRSRDADHSIEPPDLKQAFQNMNEEKGRQRKHISTFGYGGTKLRSWLSEVRVRQG